VTVSTKPETPEETRRRISEEKRRRLLDGNRHVASLDEPMRDHATVLELARLEGKLRDAEVEAESLRAIDAKRHRKEIKRLENKARGLADELAKLRSIERDAYAILGEAREPVLRALQRGDTIQAKEAETADFARDDHGARIINRGGPMRGLPALVYSRGLRAKNLTGIEHAFHAGHLRAIRGAMAEEHLLRIGQQYGAAYEIVEGLASHAGEGGGGFKPKAPLPRAIEAGETLADMRKGLDRRQRDVLDLVCGESLRAREAATQLHAGFPATIRALVGGLKAAETSRLAERERRESAGQMPIGAHVQAVSQMLRGVRV